MIKHYFPNRAIELALVILMAFAIRLGHWSWAGPHWPILNILAVGPDLNSLAVGPDHIEIAQQ